MKKKSHMPSHLWFINFKDTKVPEKFYNTEDGAHYIAHKLAKVYNELNNKKIKSCQINTEKIYVV